MADRNRAFTLAAIALPFLFLATSGLARANTITVDTITGGHVVGHCSLEDAVVAANTQATPVGSTCAAGTLNDDTIEFSVNGTIAIAATMNVTDAQLAIDGPALGISISGSGTTQIMTTAALTSLSLTNLTLTNGRVVPSAGGGAISALGSLTITGCTFTNNAPRVDFGGAISAGIDGSPATITGSSFSSNQALVGRSSFLWKPMDHTRLGVAFDSGADGLDRVDDQQQYLHRQHCHARRRRDLSRDMPLLRMPLRYRQLRYRHRSHQSLAQLSRRTWLTSAERSFSGELRASQHSTVPATTLPPGGELAITNSTLTGNSSVVWRRDCRRLRCHSPQHDSCPAGRKRPPDRD